MSRKPMLTAVAALTLAGCASFRPAEPEIVLLMGQSNMSGRGALEEIPAGALDPDPRIRVYGNDGLVRTAQEPIDLAAGQLDAVSADKNAGVGPGLAFAKARLQSTGRPIVLVPCAKGGTSIALWATSESRDTLYGSCLARAKEARRHGRIGAVLWYQGESDAATKALAALWPQRFATLVADLRRDLDDPRLPFVVVAIADAPATGKYAERFPFWSDVQAAQTALALPDVVVVEAKGLPRNPDDLHLSTAGQISLGKRLAERTPRGG